VLHIRHGSREAFMPDEAAGDGGGEPADKGNTAVAEEALDRIQSAQAMVEAGSEAWPGLG
jgi:hypothetical protein